MTDPKEKKLAMSEVALLSEKTKKFDPLATEDEIVADIRRVQEEYPTKHITRNFYRIYGKYSDGTWSKFFGTWLEARRQAGLELNRFQHGVERDVAKHAHLDIYRQFKKDEIDPWVGKYKVPDNGERFKKVMVCSDLHDKNLDPFCWSVFLDTAARVKPDHIVLAGDIFDAAEFSKYDQDPRAYSIKESFDFVKEKIFAPLREICPDTEITMLAGNHDIRILKYLANKSPHMRVLLSDVMGLTLADLFGLTKYKINLVSRFDLAAFTPAEMRNEIKTNFMVLYDCLVIDHHGVGTFGMSGCSGHTHRVKMDGSANLLRGPLAWVVMGAMAKIDFEYQERLNKSHQSFLIWHVDTKTKQCQPEHCIFTDEMIVVAGKYYVRG